MQRLCYAALSTAAASVWAADRTTALGGIPLLPTLLGITLPVALLAAVGARWRTEHRTDPRAERRVRFWRGPLGRWTFALAGLGLRREVAPAPGA